MKSYLSIILFVLSITLLSACGEAQDTPSIQVSFVTELGEISIALDTVAAPETSSYFLQFVEDRALNGKFIYRAGTLPGAPDEPKYVEGGMLSPFIDNPEIRSMADTKLPMLEVIEHRQMTGLKIERGSVFLGRNILGDGEVVPDFVIALDAIPEFDYGGDISPDQKGFPVFATVISGMDVVDAIARLPRNGETHFPFLKGQVLTEPIQIVDTKITR
ncbi:MAG: peptidylprolyl isomerase [Maricaulaceae bacterium]